MSARLTPNLADAGIHRDLESRSGILEQYLPALTFSVPKTHDHRQPARNPPGPYHPGIRLTGK